MRVLSPAATAALQQSGGLEPVLVVRVYWGGSTYTNYCDRKFTQENLAGKLIAISGIEDVVDINSSANSVSMNVTLDDADGTLKNIFDNNDIHKTYVQVLQWFSQLPFSDAFTIFEGEINTPIVWEEGSRTLKFDIVSQLQDREVGFSAEEGIFDFLPLNLIGVAWPIVFGTVAGSKVLQLNQTPTAILSSGFGLVGEILWRRELDDLQKAVDDALRNERNAYLLGIGNALKAAQYKAFNTGGFPDDPAQADQYDNAAQQYFAQSSQYAEERIKLQVQLREKTVERAFQRTLQFRAVPINHTNMPTGVPLPMQIGNYTFTGEVVGNTLLIGNLTQIRDPNIPPGTNKIDGNEQVIRYEKILLDPKFTWFDGGSEIKVFNFPRIFIVSIGAVNVINVWAKNKYGRALVPKNWYNVTYEQFGSLLITKLTFPTPLESYPGFWEAGDVEVDATSLTVGSNVVDIMRWAITNFSVLKVDDASFNEVRAKVAAFPANFTLSDRMNIVDFLKAVAFQSRCAIWINDRKFFLRFLPEELAPVETVTDSDAQLATVVITTSPTEQLVTKYIATWKERANQSTPNKIVYRYNVLKYGIHEETYDFFIFRTRELVEIAAQFWMIRKSMTWKILKCKLSLNKLRIEAFDPVQFNFTENLVSTGPVTGIVQKATFDPDNDLIDLEVWLPIRFGEMTKYAFAFPGSTSEIFPPLNDPNTITGNPWADAFGQLAPILTFPATSAITFGHKDYRYTSGTGEPANADPQPPNNTEIVTVLTNTPVLTTRPDGLDTFNDLTQPKVIDLKEVTLQATKPATFFGFVREKKTSILYACDVYMNGLFKDPTRIDVSIGYAPGTDELKDGFPIEVHRSLFVDNTKVPPVPYVEMWAQPVIWAPTNPGP